MREFAVAIVLSALILGGVLLLPYSTPLPPVDTVALQPPQGAEPDLPAAPTPPEHRRAQATPQPAAVTGGDREQGRQVYRKCQACHSLEPGKNADVVLWTGTPFSYEARAEKVWVDGAMLFDRLHPGWRAGYFESGLRLDGLGR